MALVNEAVVEQAIHATIAKQILEGLDTTSRDAILAKALVDIVKGYNFREAISQVAAAKAAEVATELMATEDWTGRVEQAIRDGFEEYLSQLRAAIPEAMKKTFSGQAGSYGSAGSVLQCWPK